MDRVSSAGLSIARELYDFVNSEALPGTGLEPDAFWSGLAAILADLAPRTAARRARVSRRWSTQATRPCSETAALPIFTATSKSCSAC